jgi:hypothetical protein
VLLVIPFDIAWSLVLQVVASLVPNIKVNWGHHPRHPLKKNCLAWNHQAVVEPLTCSGVDQPATSCQEKHVSDTIYTWLILYPLQIDQEVILSPSYYTHL